MKIYLFHTLHFAPDQNIDMNIISPQHNITNDIPAGHQSSVKRLLRKKVVNFVPRKFSITTESNVQDIRVPDVQKTKRGRPKKASKALQNE